MGSMGLASVEILRANGAREEHEVGRHILLDWCRRMIGAETIETVNLRDGRVMLVDDMGHQRGLPKNEQATVLYRSVLYRSVCRPGTAAVIVGDVAICRDRDFA